jgi:hypothetical protein
MKANVSLLIALLALRFGTDFAAGQDLGRPISSTPYDRYLGRVRTTMSSLGSNKPPMSLVEQYVRTGRSFRYYMKDPYVPQTPAETEATRAGDCKAKSLWVAYKMDDHTLRFVVGRARAESGMLHAWLLWQDTTGWWVLDATKFSAPLAVGRLGPQEFISYYSYSEKGEFVHAGALARKRRVEPKYGDHT